ncbi:hypothetical protein [Thalassotalea sp. G2M2-11]|uniref:hypothetical protein n=1 Tax=Thalassotalea sp. G2M2-11 TaxID=2787627 RepID=UPI0019D29E9B|nr:hypothetical protein [Thalassotalea sp. G2M2-11]
MESKSLRRENFEYGPLARGIFIVMLWGVWIFVFVAPFYLVYYVPLLLFVGLGLKPFLIKTGMFSVYQNYLLKRDERINETLKKGYRSRNSKKLDKAKYNREKMRKALEPKHK